MNAADIATGVWMAAIIFAAGGAWREIHLLRLELADLGRWRRRAEVALALHGIETEF